jgi:tetratricopeptide (TPR) repeat protein
MVMACGTRRGLISAGPIWAMLLACHEGRAQSALSGDVTTPPVQSQSATNMSAADLRVIAASMDEGRAALKRNAFREAVALFGKVLRYPQTQYTGEALELLGLAHQKSGQLAQARSAYEDCLRRYPDGEQAERVRQRLAGLITARADVPAPLRAPTGGPFGANHDTTWTLLSSTSVFYIHDDSFTTARDTSLAPNVADNIDDHSVHQNEILITHDLAAKWNNDTTTGRIRISVGEEHRFSTNQAGYQVDELGVSQANLDLTVKDWNLRMSGGRQSYNGDGVFGRFDGGVLSWQALSWLKVDLTGGSPANSRYSIPFANERYFYGAALGFGPLFGGLDTSIYFNEGRSRWLMEREAIGSDIHYSDPTKFLFGTIDYDVRFHQLNGAVVSGSWTAPGGTTVYGGADYRRVPFLSTWNVLFYQPFSSLYDFLKAENLTASQADQIAADQTPVYKSTMIGFSQPLTDRLTISADATYVNLSRTIPSMALDPSLATLAAGNEYYLQGQLIWTNIFAPGDMYVGALRYARQETNTQYVLDFSTRYPIMNNLAVAPRLRLGYSVDDGSATKQYTVLPSLLVDYHWNDHLTFEAELGTQWTRSVQPTVRTGDFELFGTIGFRYSFDIESGARPADRGGPLTPAGAAICRYTVRSDGTCTTPEPDRLGSGNERLQ